MLSFWWKTLKNIVVASGTHGISLISENPGKHITCQLWCINPWGNRAHLWKISITSLATKIIWNHHVSWLPSYIPYVCWYNNPHACQEHPPSLWVFLVFWPEMQSPVGSPLLLALVLPARVSGHQTCDCELKVYKTLQDILMPSFFPRNLIQYKTY